MCNVFEKNVSRHHILTCKDNYLPKNSTRTVRRNDAELESTQWISSFQPCDVILKRVDYIEDAILKGCRSILLTREVIDT